MFYSNTSLTLFVERLQQLSAHQPVDVDDPTTFNTLLTAIDDDERSLELAISKILAFGWHQNNASVFINSIHQCHDAEHQRTWEGLPTSIQAHLCLLATFPPCISIEAIGPLIGDGYVHDEQFVALFQSEHIRRKRSFWFLRPSFRSYIQQHADVQMWHDALRTHIEDITPTCLETWVERRQLNPQQLTILQKHQPRVERLMSLTDAPDDPVLLNLHAVLVCTYVQLWSHNYPKDYELTRLNTIMAHASHLEDVPRIMLTLQVCFANRTHVPEDVLETLQEVLGELQTKPYKTLAIYAQYILASIHEAASQYEDAKVHFKAVMESEHHTPNTSAFAMVRYATLSQQVDAQIHLLERALHVFLKQQNVYGEALVRHTLGVIYNRDGRKERSTLEWQQALSLNQTWGCYRLSASTFLRFARRSIGSKQWQLAQEWNTKCIEAYLSIPDEYAAGIALFDGAYIAMKQMDDALAYTLIQRAARYVMPLDKPGLHYCVDALQGMLNALLYQKTQNVSYLNRAQIQLDTLKEIDTSHHLFKLYLKRFEQCLGHEKQQSVQATQVHIAGHWFQVGVDAPRQSIQHRRSLCSILRFLAQQKVNGAGATLEGLIQAGWSDDVLSYDSAKNRLHVALSTLRKMGLEGELLYEDGVYHLSEQCVIIFDS